LLIAVVPRVYQYRRNEKVESTYHFSRASL
jgi:hypothetical protein